MLWHWLFLTLKTFWNYNLLHNRVEGTHARLKMLLRDSMRDLCNCWNAMNNMLILQHTMIKDSFEKNINGVEQRFNTPIYRNIWDFVSREAWDTIFYVLKRFDNVGTNNSICGWTLIVTDGLPYACELARLISIYGSIPSKSIHVHWRCYPFIIQMTYVTLRGT